MKSSWKIRKNKQPQVYIYFRTHISPHILVNIQYKNIFLIKYKQRTTRNPANSKGNPQLNQIPKRNHTILLETSHTKLNFHFDFRLEYSSFYNSFELNCKQKVQASDIYGNKQKTKEYNSSSQILKLFPKTHL